MKETEFRNYKDVFSSWANAELEPVARNIAADCSGVTLIAVIRNEQWRLPCFMEHYRKLGIERFVFIDNNSTDDTCAWLSKQPDADVYLCRAQYSSLAQRGWRHSIMEQYGYGRWYLNLDADEFLVFDGMQTHTLLDLVTLADSANITRIRGIMLDMYGKGPLLEHTTIETCHDVMEYCRYFDTEGYATKIASHRISIGGGPRKRMFQRMGHTNYPELTKYPLFKLGKEDLMVGGHHMLPLWKNFQSHCVLGILHYKFSKNDRLKIQDALEQGQYWNGSVEYKCYAQWLEHYAQEPLYTETSRELLSEKELLETRLLHPIYWQRKDGGVAFSPFVPSNCLQKNTAMQAWKYITKRLLQSSSLDFQAKVRSVRSSK